jgi:hypothetical protein
LPEDKKAESRKWQVSESQAFSHELSAFNRSFSISRIDWQVSITLAIEKQARGKQEEGHLISQEEMAGSDQGKRHTESRRGWPATD